MKQVEILFDLLTQMVDTNLLHRGGCEGVRPARARAADF
jgi:triphosphoribosyl-dephospho-CoA synthetase